MIEVEVELFGDSVDSSLMGSFCGDRSNVPSVMQTTQNHIRIRLGGGGA